MEVLNGMCTPCDHTHSARCSKKCDWSRLVTAKCNNMTESGALAGVLSKVEMRLEDEALGLELHGRTGAGVFIRDVQAASLAERYKLSGGLQLIAVQGESVEGREYDDALGLLRAAVRAARGGDAGAAVPLSLTWRRPSEVAMVVYASKTQAPSVGLHLGDMAIPCAGYCVEILGFRDGTPAEAVPALRRGMALTQVGNRDVKHLSFAEVTQAIKVPDPVHCRQLVSSLLAQALSTCMLAYTCKRTMSSVSPTPPK